MAEQPETKFKRIVVAQLKALPGAWVLPTQEIARRGVPDILVCYRGRFIAIELKMDGGKPDALQEHNLRKVAEAGGIAFWATPSSLDTQLQALLANVEAG